MTFQIKDFRSITASMINVSRASNSQITDYSVGSVARTLMEAPAIEIEELYLQMLLGLQEAIPVAIYHAFDFDVIPKRPASGLLTLHFAAGLSEALTIAQGATFDASGVSFQATAAVTAEPGATKIVFTVASELPGVVGNIAPNAIRSSQVSLPPGTTFANLSFTSGHESESEVERKARFIQFVMSLARGTVQSIRFCASNATVLNGAGAAQEYVTRVGIDEAQGRVNVYLYGSSGAPSADLLSNALKLINGYVDSDTGNKISGYRPAGVEVLVLPMIPRAIDVAVSVATLPGFDQSSTRSTAITNSINLVISSVAAGAILRADAIVGSVLALPGVLACYLASDTNVPSGQFEVLTPGVVTVAWLPNA